MNILVLNGSPKGEESITLQAARYLEQKFPAHTFSVLHVGQRIRQFEKDFSAARDAIESADLLLFCYPVYTFLAPSQLHRFLELMKAADLPLAGKYAAQITTSLHFYDVTAHRFVQENCDDLGLLYLVGAMMRNKKLQKKIGGRKSEGMLLPYQKILEDAAQENA